MKHKLTPEQARAEWVKALRSGEYRQTTRKLCEPIQSRSVDQEYAYCCLGVACETYRQIEQGPEWGSVEIDSCDGEEGLGYFGEPDVLPEPVKKWLGLDTDSGILVDEIMDYEELTEANDGGATFAQIANWIEQGKVALEDG